MRTKKLEELLKKANTLPKESGCYLMRSKLGEVIYVGKAKSLKSRVTSYFNNSPKSAKTQILVGHIEDFEFIITSSDAESFVLENNLIKEYRPKYNIRLKDDKSYPYLQVDTYETFPRLQYVRRPKRKKGRELFGPFPVGSNISNVLRILTKSFELRDCSSYDFKTRKTPCLLYQMKQCSASCVDLISQQEYEKDLNNALNFFKTKSKQEATLEILTNKMMMLAEQEEFEQAAQMRDNIEVLNNFVKQSYDQNVELLNDNNFDIISFFVGETEVDISIYMVRLGNLLGHKNFHFLKSDFISDIEDELILAMVQYYSQTQDTFPEKIITSFSKETVPEFELALKTIWGEGVKIKVLSSSKKYQSLLDSTQKHAMEAQRVRIENQDSVYVGLNRLKELLSLKDRPRLLECYDIAIWQGKSPTAARITFDEGKPDKTRYRHYHLNERPEGNNDFAMMREVFERRLQRGDLPDVFIVDGGIAQVNTVKKVLEELNINVPVCGIAKARDLTKGFQKQEIKNSDERLIIPGRSNPYILNKCPSLMRIVVHMRDEAHRFSRRLHHKTEHKRVIRSWVDDVKGLPKEIKEMIIKNNSFTVEEFKNLNIQQIQDFFGIKIQHARTIYEFLHAKN